MKKVLVILLVVSLVVVSFAGCANGNPKEPVPTQNNGASNTPAENNGANNTTNGNEKKSVVIPDSYNDLEGAHAMILKMTGIRQYQLFYEGFNLEWGAIEGTHKTADLSPAEASITEQVKAIDEAIASKVSSISVGPTGSTGYDEVLKKAKDAGIGIFSVDAAVSPEHRVVHVNMADALEVGAYCVASAIMISQGVEYDSNAGTTILEQVADVMKNFKGDKITIGVLSTRVDAPVQNSWILGIDKELEKDIYGGKVSTEIKYTNDDLQNAAVQINAFVTEGKVDSFLSLTANASVVVGQILSETGTDLKATGIGLPSQQSKYMPSNPSDDPFDYPMPWVIMWDPINVGRVLAATIDAYQKGEYNGKIGDTVTVPASGNYKEATYVTTQHSDGGPELIANTPMIFNKHNIAEWKDIF